MKKAIIVTAFIFSLFTGNAQDSNSKVKLHAITAGMGSFHFQKDVNGHDGICAIADLTISLNKNLLSVSYAAGSSLKILEGPNYGFNEYCLLYGREWKVRDWLRFEGFAGVGHFKQNSGDSNIGDDNAISFPLRINTKFYFTKKFGMGFNTNYSINSVNNNFSTNVIFHYRFN